MECYRVQERLSEYIDGVAGPDEKAIIYEHLKTCQKCKEAYFDLKKTVGHLKELDEIEPPSWLTQKVMAKIKEEAVPKKGILQRLFYPLHIKLPLEAFATIVIAISALYIFKTVQPEIQFAKEPAQEVTPQIPPSPPSVKEDKEGLPRSEEKDNVFAYKERKTFEAKPTDQPSPAPEPKTTGKLESPKSIAPSEQPELMKAERAPSPAKKRDEGMPSAGAVAKDESRQEAMPAAPKLKAMAEKKRESISITINVKDLDFASKEIEKVVMQLGGKLIKTEPSENKIVLIGELKSQKLKELIDKLEVIGEVKGKETLPDKIEVDIEIRIEVKR